MKYLSRATRLVASSDRPKYENYIRLGVFLAVLTAVGTAILFRDQVTSEQVGYGGVALTALVASGGIIIPAPALVAVCIASARLDPLLIGLIAGFAETLGETTGYLLGYSGQGIITQTRLYLRLEGWLRRRGWLLLFLISVLPNPIFDIVGVAAGALRYPIWRFLAVVCVGKLIKWVTLAYACFYSIEWLIDLFSIEWLKWLTGLVGL